MFKVIQLSDCHVSAKPDARYRGINPRSELERLFPAIQRFKPDLLLLTGDLAEDASDDAYAYLAACTGNLGVPVITIPGNHDLAKRQQAYFPITATDEPVVFDAGAWQLVLLNSAVAGQIPGSLSSVVLKQLQQALANNSKPKLVAVHHQPVLVASPWIDRYPLLEAEKFWSSVDDGINVQAVVWGHIHHEYSEQRDGIQLLGTPSSAANSLATQEKFSFDARGPACRRLVLYPEGRLETGILRSGDQ